MKSSMKLIIDLPDGYNGHTVPYYAKPIMEGKSIVWLQCAVPGKEYMKRWAHRETWEKAMISETARYRHEELVARGQVQPLAEEI